MSTVPRSSSPPRLGSRTILYASCGFVLGVGLTAGGYVIDYHALYGNLPSNPSLGMLRGLHDVTPVHYFTDLFALILALAGGLAGRFQDRVIFYSRKLEELVEVRTRDLGRSEERYALVVEGSRDGIWDWDLSTNAVYYSARWKKMIGCGDEDIGGAVETWLDRVHVEDRERVRASIHAHLEGTTSHFNVDYRILHADGSYRWMLARGVTTRDEHGRPKRMAGSQADIHDSRRVEGELRQLALYDQLTNLPNRTQLFDRTKRILRRARLRKANVAVLHVGIDRFKKVNETLGPKVGDQLLVQVAARLLELVADLESRAATSAPKRTVSGSVFRAEADEFAVVLEDTRSLRDATRLASRIVKSHERPITIQGRKILLSVTIGIAVGRGKHKTADELLRDAQTAMNRGKTLGCARFEVFDRDMVETVDESLHLETELHQALEKRELQVWYQPVCVVDSRRVVGFEALARWEHPERGVITPDHFVPIAEETGMIVRMSRQMFADVFERLSTWQEQFPNRPDLAININLSPKYLLHPDLQGDLGKLLRKTGSDASRIHLEITESSFIDNPQTVVKILKDLKNWGFRIALDDFGTGYSSLSMLHSLPFDILKIDREFVSKLGEDEDVRKIVETLVSLARKLDLDIVAEGIETEQQRQELLSMRCKYGQGHLLGRPMTVEAAEELIRSSSAGRRKPKTVAV